MFKCAVCESTFGPGVKPHRIVVGERHQAYHNEYFREDEYGIRHKHEVDSTGTEIVREVLVCDFDAQQHYGIVVPPSKPPKEPTSKFEEKLADKLPNTLINIVVHNALERTSHAEEGNKRARRDAQVAIPLVKFFVDQNPNFVF